MEVFYQVIVMQKTFKQGHTWRLENLLFALGRANLQCLTLNIVCETEETRIMYTGYSNIRLTFSNTEVKANIIEST